MTQFSTPPVTYDQSNENFFRNAVKAALDACFRRGGTVEIGAGRLVLEDTVTGTRYSVTMVSGTLTTTAVTI